MRLPRRLLIGLAAFAGFLTVGAGVLFGLAIISQSNTTAVLSYGIWDYTDFSLTADLQGATGPISWSTSGLPTDTTTSFSGVSGNDATLTLTQLRNGPDVGSYTFYVRAEASSGQSDQIAIDITVTPRRLTLSGTFTAQNKVYDRTTSATIGTNNLVIVDGDILYGDDVSFTPTVQFSSAAVGNGKTVSISAGSNLSGAQRGNYMLWVTGAPTTTANITAKPLTVTPPTFTKQYDAGTTASATGTPSLNGVINGDTVTITGTPTFSYATKSVGTGISVTPSVAYGLGGSSAGNYSVSQPTMSGDITAAPISLTWTANNRAYNATTSASVYVSADTHLGSDDIGTVTATTATFSQAAKGTGLTVSISGISADGADAGNYVFPTTGTATADITARSVTLGGTLSVPASRVYDRTTAATISDASTLTLVNVVASESSNVTLSSPVAAFATKNVGTGKTVTLTSASLGGSAASNYVLSLDGAPTATAAITQKSLTVTITAANKTYNGTNTASVTYGDDRISGDSFTIGSTNTFSDKNVGTAKTVTASSIALSTGDAANYAPNTTATTTANITARTMTVTVTGGSKTYDGTTTAPVTYVDDRVAGDSVTVSGTATYATKTIGVGKTISVSSITLGGADGGNYVANSTTSGSGTISARTLTVTATASNKTYNQSTAASVSLSDNRISGDTLSVTYSTATFPDKNAGTARTVTVSGVGISGTDSGNYVVATTTTTTADIAKKTLTVTATGTNKPYDGTTTATVTYADDRLSGDVLTVSGTANFTDKNIGTNKTINITGITLGGTDAGNYQPNSTATATATITGKLLTISGTYTASNKTYDGTTNATANVTPPASPTLTGVTAGDTVTLGGTPSFAFSQSTIGTGLTITAAGYTLGGADAGSYTLVMPTTTASIVARTVTVGGTLTVPSTRTYDGTASTTLTLGNLSLSNVAPADSGNSAKLALATATATYANKNVGNGKTVSVSAATLSGTSMGNYSLSLSGAPTATANITARTLTVTATGTNRTYDRTTTATVTLADDRVSGDVITTAYTGATFADKTVGTGKTVSVSGISVTGTDSGNYTANTSTTTTANITARSLTVTMTAANKTYDGTTAATPTFSDNRVTSDVLTVSGTATFVNKNVGTGKAVSATGLSLSGTDAANYVTSSTPSATANITARSLAVTATAANKTYDGTTAATPTFSDNRVSGDVLTVSGTATFVNKNVGTGKTVSVSGIALSGTDSGNYSQNTTTSTTADISARTLTVTFTPSNKTYDATTTATGTVGDNRVSGDVLTISGSATFPDKLIGTGKTVTYGSISVTGTDSGNYTANTSTTGTANITARALTITGTYTASNRTYDGTTAATGNVSVPASPTLAGVQGSDTVSLSGTPTFAFSQAGVGTGISISTSGYSLTGADNGNYTLTLPVLSANITQKSISVGGSFSVTSTRVYNQATTTTITDSSQLTMVGVVAVDAGNSSRLSMGSFQAAFSNKNAGTSKTVSLTSATLSGTSALNYSLTLSGAPTTTADITPRSLTVSIIASNKVYDGTTTASVTVADNRLSGDTLTINSGSAAFADKLVGNTKVVTLPGISLSGLDSGNYVANSSATANANITSRTLTVTGTITASNRAYDGTTDATGNVSVTSPGLTPIQASDDVVLAGTAVFTFAQKNTGTGIGITTSGWSLGGTDASNYTLTLPTYSANITARPVTVGGTLVVPSNKGYDATTATSITDTSQLTIVNVPAADAGDQAKLSLTGLVATYANKNVGTGKTVSLTSASLTGTASSNYALSLSGAPTATASIGARALSVTITAASKTYNASDAATATYYDNRVSGDTISVSGTATFSDKNWGTSKTVTASNIAVTGTDAGNYTWNTTATTTASITKRTITVTGTFTPSNRQYDATTDATAQVALPVSPGLSAVQGSDDCTLTGTPVFTFAQATIGTGIAIQGSGYSLSGADAANYTLTQPTTSANITQRPLTIGGSLVVAGTKTYDRGTSATITDAAQLTLVNVPAGDAGDAAKVALTSLTATYGSKTVGTGKAVTLATASLTGTTASNYTLSLTGAPSTTADITQKSLLVSITGGGKTYDGSASATVTYGDNRISGDTISISGTAAFPDKNVGTGRTITATGITLAGADAANYNQNTTATVTANVTARALGVYITGGGKVYDQSTTAAVTYNDSRVSGDVLTVSGTATFANKNVGTGKTVTATGVSVTGTDAGNYSWATTVTTTANITAKPLTVTITASNKTYDQGTSASVTYGDNRITGDVLTISGTATFANKNVGTGKTVTATGITLGSTDAGNYSQNTSATTTADITARSLTVTISSSSKVYDATNTASVTYGDNRITGDALTFSSTPTFSDKTAANGKTVTANGITLGGADAGNYSQNTSATTTANITRRTLTITGTFTPSNRQYDATTDATAQVTLPLSPGLSAVQGSDDCTLTGTPSFTFAQATIGTGIAIQGSGYSLSGVDAANYTLTQPTTSANITQRPLTVGGALVVSASKTYDRGTTATITDASQLTLVNVPAGDANTAAKVALTSLAAAYADKNAGTGKTVTLTSAALTGTTSSNYTLSYATAPTTTAAIVAKSLTVTISASSKTYDQGTTATVTYGDNRISGDSLTFSSTATFADKNVGTGKTVTATGITLGSTDAANYTPNTTATTTANITARTMAVTITASNKTYDATTTASVTYADNRIGGDSLTVNGTANFSSKTVANGKTVTATGINLTGTDAANYAPNTSTTTTANITLRPMTVTITASNKTYDGTTTVSVTYASDKVSGDSVTITGSPSFSDKTAGAGKTVTAVSIGVTGTDAANYTWNTSTTTTADISQRSLAVTAVADTKMYDATTSATAVYSDNRVSGDVLTVSGTATFATKVVAAGKTVSIADITVTGTDAANYTWNATTTSTAEITQRPLEVTGTLQAQDKVYDGTRTASYTLAQLELVGVQGSDAVGLTNPRGRFRLNANVGNSKIVELTSYQLTGADLSNYAVSVTNSPITYASITPRTLNITISAANKTYDGTDTASVTYADDRVSGDVLTASGTATFSDKNIGTGKTVTATGIAITGASAGNYTQNTTATTTANITVRTLNVTISAANKTYDGSVGASVSYLDNRVSGDILTVSGTANFSSKTVATGKTVTATGIAITGTDATNYTQNTTATTTANITVRTLNVTISAANKTYDRTTAASVTYADDRVSGDILTVSGTANFSSKTVATGKTVTATGIAITGTDAANYTQNTTATTTADITAKALAVSITASNKTYDALTNAAVTYADNRISGDALTVTGTATFDSKNIGTGKTVTATGITLGGADSGNYSHNTTATATANITARNVTVTGTFSAANRAYDATTDATSQVTLPLSPGLSAVQGSDDCTLTGTPTFTFAQATVGTSIGIQGSGYSLSGADAGNYTLTQPTLSANITARPVTIGGALVVPATRTYDRTAAATITDPAQLVLVNVPAGDANTPSKVALTSLTASFPDKTVGTGRTVSLATASLTGTTAGNYSLSIVGSPTTTADITAKALAVTITASNKTYDQTTSASVTYADNRITGDSLTVSGTASFPDKNVGTGRTVTASSILLSGTDAANYAQNTTATTTANITTKALAVTITATNKTYDQSNSASVTYADNRITGDVLTVSGTATFANKNVGTAKTVTATGITLSGTDAANYSQNTTATTTANITTKALAVTITASNKTYDRTTAATVTYGDDRISGDVLTVSGTANFTDKTVAAGKTVTATGITLSGTDAANYSQNTTATTTADIMAKALAVTITASNKTYDQTTSASVTYADNRITGDSLTVSGTSTFANKNVGTAKTVTATGITLSGTDAANYSQNTSTTTTANITARILSVTASASDKTYDQNNTATVTLNDDRVAGDVLNVTKSSSTFPDKNVGNSRTVTVTGISISGADAANYSQNTSTTTTANITARTLSVTVTAGNKTYDGSDAASVTYSDNRLAGDVLTVTGDATYSSKTAANGKTVTVNNMAITGTDAGNYALPSMTTSAASTANITRRMLTITGIFTVANRQYDATTDATAQVTPPGNIGLSDVQAGDDTVLTGTPAFTFAQATVGNGIVISTSGYVLGGADAANYDLTLPSFTANITVRPVTISGSLVVPPSRTYDRTSAATISNTAALTIANVPAGDANNSSRLALSGLTAAYPDKHVGTGRSITLTSAALTGSTSSNYSLSLAGAPITTADITAKALAVTITAGNKTYDRTAAATVTYSDDRITGDSLTVSGTATFANKNVGTAKTVTAAGITLSGTDAANYSQNTTATTTANITARSMTVTITASDRTYDRTIAATVTYSDDRITGDSLTVSGTATFANKNVGTAKTVTAAGITLSGTDAANYSQNTTATTTANITARPLSVTASASNKAYDGNSSATVTLSDDRITGDTLTATKVSSTFPDKNVGTGRTVTVTGISISGVDAANYSQNTTATTTANITARPLAVTASASDKTYDSSPSAVVSWVDDRIAGDVFTVSGTATFPDKNVGTGRTVTATGITLGGTDAGNYTPNPTATTTASITRRALAVTAVADDKRYDANNTATAVYSDNRLAGDVFTVSGTATFPDEELGADRPVSIVGITLSGPDAGNYSPNPTASSSADIFVRVITSSVDASVTATMSQASVELQYFRVASPLMFLGDLVPGTDSRLTFRRTGYADIVCDVPAASVTSTTSTCAPGALADGTWTYRSSQLISGLMVAASEWHSLTIDTAAPSFTKPITMAAPTGASTTATKSATPAIVIPDANIGDTVVVTATLTTGASTAGVHAAGTTTYSCTFVASATVKSCALPPLNDGAWVITARIIDVAGNTSPPSTPITVVVDTAAPAAPSPPSFNGPLSTDATPVLSVPGAESGVTITINARNNSVAGATSSCSFVAAPGVSSCEMTPMPGGTWTITATATDAAGNVSPVSASSSLIVSAALAPSAPMVSKGVSLPGTTGAKGPRSRNYTTIAGAYKGSTISVSIVADLGKPASLINVSTVNFVVFDSAGKVVRRTVIPLKPTDTGAAIEIPKALKGARVVVYTTNACGVSGNATLWANVDRGTTTATSSTAAVGAAGVAPTVSVDSDGDITISGLVGSPATGRAVPASSTTRNGMPNLAGDVMIPSIEFAASETALDAADKAALDKVVAQVKGRCGTLLVSGFSRHNTRDTRRYLQNLADFRALNVARYLSSRGVTMWIDYQGFIVKSDDKTGTLSRRVEVRWRPA